MRNGQNKRMRGRNRRGHNPLTRVYESNGPDVKIRGTAHHIAEKYAQLARDAQSSGDPISAEGYMQHAEHYVRLIAAAQAQFAPQHQQHNPNQQHPYQRSDQDSRDDYDDDAEDAGAGEQPPMQPYQGGAPTAQPMPRPQPPAFQGHPQVRENAAQSDVGLPAFITGSAGTQGQPGNGFDTEHGQQSERGDRFGRRRRRFRPRGPNDFEPRAEATGDAPSADAAPQAGDPQPEAIEVVQPKPGE